MEVILHCERRTKKLMVLEIERFDVIFRVHASHRYERADVPGHAGLWIERHNIVVGIEWVVGVETTEEIPPTHETLISPTFAVYLGWRSTHGGG